MSQASLAPEKVRFVVLIGLSVGLTAFDETSLGVVLPTLRQEFETTPAATHWVVNAYLVVMASLVAVSGRLADFLPADRLWRFGLGFFTVMSVAAGFAPDVGWLIAARAAQGIGAALIFSSGVALIGRVFADDERGRAFGIFSSIITVLLLIGPTTGGLLTEFLSWRWVFWILVPPALLCLWFLKLPSPTPTTHKQRPHLDVPGFATLTLSIATLSIAIMQGNEWGWGSPAILCLFAVSITAGVLFYLIESRSRAPLIDLAVFRNKSVAAALMTMFMAQYRRVGTSIYLALFLRDGLGFSPLIAGIALVPAYALLPISTVIVGRYADRFGARIVILVGIATVGAIMLWMALAADIRSYWVLLPALLFITCFQPTMFSPPRKAMLHDLPENLHAQISGVSVTAQMLGGTLTISVGSVLLTITGATWPIFLVMALGLAALWLVAFLWLERSPNPAATT